MSFVTQSNTAILYSACTFTKCDSVTSHFVGVSGVQRFFFIVININYCYIISFSVFGKVNINFVLLAICVIANFFYSCIFTINQSSVLTCFCVYLIQLFYVYSVSICSTCFYIMNLLAAHAYIAIAQNYAIFASTDSNTIGIYSCCACCYAIYSQGFLQCQTSCSNIKVLFVFLQLHRNCIFVSLININTLACGIFSICINGRKIYIYTIIISTSYCQLFTI